MWACALVFPMILGPTAEDAHSTSNKLRALQMSGMALSHISTFTIFKSYQKKKHIRTNRKRLRVYLHTSPLLESGVSFNSMTFKISAVEFQNRKPRNHTF